MIMRVSVRESWCAWGDLNSHALRHWNLNPARLPIPPQALQGVILQWLADSSKYQPALGSRTQPHTAHTQLTLTTTPDSLPTTTHARYADTQDTNLPSE